MYIDGEWCLSEGGMTYEAINPATSEVIGLVPKGTREDARRAIAAAQKAQGSWSKVPLWERAALCTWMAEVIEKHVDDLARVLTEEHGKPHHSEAYDEARETPNNFRLAGEAIKMLEGSTIPVADPHKRVYTIRQPRGVYAILTPWNFPMAIPSEYLPYAIVAGNTVCWAPAPTAALSAIKLMECMIEAGLPKGVINLVTGPGDVVGDELVSNPGTQGVGLTGSPATGEIVAKRAGLKPLLMELGGNGPTVILNDADPVRVAEVVASACYYHAGQVCSSTVGLLLPCGASVFLHRAHSGGRAAQRCYCRRAAEAYGRCAPRRPLGSEHHHGPIEQSCRPPEDGSSCGRCRRKGGEGAHRRFT